MIAPAACVNWVWGSSEPLPPPLAAGWKYVRNPQDWLLVESPNGGLFYVGCVEGDYYLIARRQAPEGSDAFTPGEPYADTDGVPFRLPVEGGILV